MFALWNQLLVRVRDHNSLTGIGVATCDPEDASGDAVLNALVDWE